MSPDVIAAFLAGVASILGAGFSLRRAHKQERQHCDERIRDMQRAYDKGMETGLQMRERDA